MTKIKDIWQDGFDAFVNGKEWTDNPYPEFGDNKFDRWNEGFDDAETAQSNVKPDAT